MDNNGHNHMPFVHPSRAHLFKQPPISDNTFKHTSEKCVAQTWNNRKDRYKDDKPDDQLLVFGYASKLFPPDEHSHKIAKNKHLIKWNEDYKMNLLIDRYDCRASLHNSSDFDGSSWKKTYELSVEEIKLEKHLDEERYRALFVEELEEDIRHEEELKRLHASIAGGESDKYKEVAHDYNSEPAEQYDPTEPTNDEEDQKLFTAPSSLAVPPDLEIPATEKMHAIIEKTALFVSRQGLQMEIVLKAKQANNSQFQFLQFDHYLNPYYKHMVKRIKEGKYSPGVTDEQDKEEDDESSSDDDGGYLHPSLFASTHIKAKPAHEEKTKAIRSIDPDHPLAKLIEKGRQANAIKQYQLMAEAVYNYYQQEEPALSSAKTSSSSLEPPPLPSFMSMASLQSSSDNSSSCYPSHLSSAPLSEETPQQTAIISSSISTAHWNPKTPIVPPPPDLQEVVEEIAKKVALEGQESEKALICQADADYSFLNPWHELHPYYQYRKMSWIQILNPPPPPNPDSSKESSNTDDPKEAPLGNQEDSKAVPISFSIKTRKDGLMKGHPLSSASASVLGEDASDEDDDVEFKKAESKKSKPSRRRFSDHPPDFLSQHSSAHVTESAVEAVKEKEIKLELKTSLQGTPPDSSSNPLSSSFTAITSTGEAARVSDLREKQAARRRKALLFLQTRSQENKENVESESKTPEVVVNVEESKLAALASEDIFDLSSPADEEASKTATETSPPPPCKTSPVPRSPSSSPSPSPSKSKNQKDLSSNSESPSSPDHLVPSAYRVKSSRKAHAVKSSPLKRSRKRSRSREVKRHKRSVSKKSSRHKHSSKHSSRDKHKRKKKKEKKSKKRRRKSSSTSSSSEDIDCGYSGKSKNEESNLNASDKDSSCEIAADKQLTNVLFKVDNDCDKDAGSIRSAQQEESSDGEIISE